MAAKSIDVSELFHQQRELNAEQVRISQELALVNQKILYVLTNAVIESARVRGDAPAMRAIAQGRAKLPGKRRSWFERGESLKLIRRVARRAMRPAQVVHAVMDAKGYSKTLSAEDKKRAESALHQAVIIAVKAGKLARNEEGFVRVKA